MRDTSRIDKGIGEQKRGTEHVEIIYCSHDYSNDDEAIGAPVCYDEMFGCTFQGLKGLKLLVVIGIRRMWQVPQSIAEDESKVLRSHKRCSQSQRKHSEFRSIIYASLRRLFI